MKPALLLSIAALLSTLALAACGGAPTAPALDVPGADSSAAPVEASEPEAPGAECPEGSPDCAR